MTVRDVLLSAPFWYVLLAFAGAVLMASGTAIVAGAGYGLLVFGVLCVCGSEVVRRGMTRV